MTAQVQVPPPGPDVLRDLRLVLREARYEQLAFWSDRMSAMFTVGFSVVFLLLLGATAGRAKVEYLGNISLVTYYSAALIAYGVMATCFTNLAISLVIRRETGLLKRLRLSPLPAWILLAAIFASTLVVVLVQLVLLLTISRIGFGVVGPANVGAFLLALIIGTLGFTAMGVAMSTLIHRQNAAGPVTSTVFFVLLFFSGLWFPIDPNSWMHNVAGWFPVGRFIDAVVAAFTTAAPGIPAVDDLLVVAVWGLAALWVAFRSFSWAPSRS